MKKKNLSLCDYFYVDTKKILSVYNQLTGAVVSTGESTSATVHQAEKKKKYDFKIFKSDSGNAAQEGQAAQEQVKSHHALFQELEQELLDQGQLLDLSGKKMAEKVQDKAFRNDLKDTFCIKVTGRCVIEHYERMKKISESFPDIAELINQSNKAAVKSTDAYKELVEQIKTREAELSKIKDKNARVIQQAPLKEQKKKLEDLLENHTKVTMVEPWILDGLRTWIDTFIPGIINLRVYPSQEHMDVQIFGHLKQENFFDMDVSAFHFTYGSVPTEDITMLGIVSSVPNPEDAQFNPHKEFLSGDLSSKEAVERGFRSVFRGFESFEQMVRTCRYPRVLVSPLLVYREMGGGR
ncbi:MAG: hypothetical protein Q3M24_15600 [Candidatus Electrothrix aestuarii]|uniref:Uncharacterized protein n=1 Tax=Candidatus Electrothrix aestuarii TaxID=3062594 RepID=A0AAU8LS56_9BACT|nr:hypothetical protein [Candidatus Electrothrix aestuarii]